MKKVMKQYSFDSHLHFISCSFLLPTDVHLRKCHPVELYPSAPLLLVIATYWVALSITINFIIFAEVRFKELTSLRQSYFNDSFYLSLIMLGRDP